MAVVVYKWKKRKKKKKKKTTRGLRVAERALRRSAMALEETGRRYGRAHRKSRRKRKNGALRDLSVNLFKAARKGQKKLKPHRIIRF